MTLVLCLGLLLTASAGEIVHEQGNPSSQQSCSSDPDTVTLLQSAVRIPIESTRQEHDAKVIDELETQEDDQDENDEKDEEMDEEEEDDKREEDDEEDQVNVQASPEDDEEEQIIALAERGTRGKPKLWGRSFTTKAIGERICHICKSAKIQRCSQKGIWPKKKVRVDNSRRRDEGPHECMAVSVNKRNRQHLGFGGGQNRKKGNMGAWRASRKKMCACLKTIMNKCQNADCIQERICDCPAVCHHFKIDLGCKISLLEIRQASERNNISESLRRQVSTKSDARSASDSKLDGTVEGKCTSETQ